MTSHNDKEMENIRIKAKEVITIVKEKGLSKEKAKAIAKIISDKKVEKSILNLT